MSYYKDKVRAIIDNSKYAGVYYKLENQVKILEKRILLETRIFEDIETFQEFVEVKKQYNHLIMNYEALLEKKIKLREKILDNHIDMICDTEEVDEEESK